MELTSCFFLIFASAAIQLSSAQQIGTFKNCSCIAFRLDSVQDWYLRLGQMAVIQAFVDEDVPLSVGVIANAFEISDSDLVYFVKSAVSGSGGNIEIINNGFDQEDFASFNLENQLALMRGSGTRMFQSFGRPLTVFDPPFGSFNINTTRACTTLNYTAISSQRAIDTPPYDFGNPTLWRFPAGAATADLRDVQLRPVASDVTWTAIRRQLFLDGFSAVMMNPRTFYTWTGSSYGTTINQTAIDELKNLLRIVKASGLCMTVLGRMHTLFAPGVRSCNASTSPTTSTSAPVSTSASATSLASTTGRTATTTSAPATTGVPRIQTTGSRTSAGVTTGIRQASTSGPSATTGAAILGTTGRRPATTGIVQTSSDAGLPTTAVSPATTGDSQLPLCSTSDVEASESAPQKSTSIWLSLAAAICMAKLYI